MGYQSNFKLSIMNFTRGLIISILVIACKNPAEKSVIKTGPDSMAVSISGQNEKFNNKADTINFFSNCSELLSRSMTGTLQDENSNLLDTELRSGCKNAFENFHAFAFVYPMKDPDKQPDVHALNINFPINIKVFERIIGDKWNFLRTVEVNTLEEYWNLRFKTIYHLD